MAAKKNVSVYAALGANLLIAITKFIAGGITRSSAMISEGIHSTVDCTNQLLLLHGLKQSKRPADKRKPFGYGKELYFWSFMVALLLFTGGGVFSIYEGVHKMMHPEPMERVWLGMAILGEPVTPGRIAFLVLLLISVAGLKFTSGE